LCSSFQPLTGLFSFNFDRRWLSQGVIVAQFLNEAPVTGAARVCHYNPIKRALGGTHATQSQFYWQVFLLKSLKRKPGSLWSARPTNQAAYAATATV
jgi:hypothetical protein